MCQVAARVFKVVLFATIYLLRNSNANKYTVNINSSSSVNVTIDLTQLNEVNELIDIPNLIINYSPELMSGGLTLCSKFVKDFDGSDKTSNYLIAQNRDNTNVFTRGIKLQNKSLMATFFSDFSMKWKFNFDCFTYASPTIDTDGMIYLYDSCGNLYSIYPNGELKWKLTFSCCVLSSATVSDSVIYVSAADSNLYAIHQNNSIAWKYNIEGSTSISSATTIDDVIIVCSNYIPTGVGHLHSIFKNGTLKWMSQIGYCSSLTFPAVSEDTKDIYIGSDDGYLYSVSTKNGSVKWSYKTNCSRFSAPATNGGVVYVSSSYSDTSRSSYFFAIDTDGNLKWKFLAVGSNEISSSPVVSNEGVVYFGSSSGAVYAVDQDGKLLWKTTISRSSGNLAIGADGIIYGGASNCLFAFHQNGTIKWNLWINEKGWPSPTISRDGTIYFSTLNYPAGILYSISIKNFVDTHPWPTFHKDNLHSGLQLKFQNLKFFDFRYLTLEGLSRASGSISFELTSNQSISLLNIIANITIASLTASKSTTNTLSATETPADTRTNTRTNTKTYTSTSQHIQDIARTKTQTTTSTATLTTASSKTLSQTLTPTNTKSIVLDYTPTPSLTETATFQRTKTLTHTFSRTKTPTNTYTSIRTNVPTKAKTKTPTLTSTNVLTKTSTLTETKTSSLTKTKTKTKTKIKTKTQTVTDTLTRTESKTKVKSKTKTETKTKTKTPTSTSTPTPTPTETKANLNVTDNQANGGSTSFNAMISIVAALSSMIAIAAVGVLCFLSNRNKKRQLSIAPIQLHQERSIQQPETGTEASNTPPALLVMKPRTIVFSRAGQNQSAHFASPQRCFVDSEGFSNIADFCEFPEAQSNSLASSSQVQQQDGHVEIIDEGTIVLSKKTVKPATQHP